MPASARSAGRARSRQYARRLMEIRAPPSVGSESISQPPPLHDSAGRHNPAGPEFKVSRRRRDFRRSSRLGGGGVARVARVMMMASARARAMPASLIIDSRDRPRLLWKRPSEQSARPSSEQTSPGAPRRARGLRAKRSFVSCRHPEALESPSRGPLASKQAGQLARARADNMR